VIKLTLLWKVSQVKWTPMKIEKIFNAERYGGSQRYVLLPPFLGTGVVVSRLLAWIYNKTQLAFGMEVAQVGIATGVLVMMLIIASGVKLASRIDQAIKDQRSIFSQTNRGRLAKLVMRLWGYEMDSPETVEDAEPEPNPMMEELGLTYAEAMDLVQQTRKRGRRPDFTLEQWLPVTVKWETRDPIRDAFTLGELIIEFLGKNDDGSPIISEQSYYKTWRPRALAELERRAKAKKEAFQKYKN
jgi:hypothetical protein